MAGSVRTLMFMI